MDQLSSTLPLDGIDPAMAVQLAAAVEDDVATHQPITDLKKRLCPEGDLVERTILIHAASKAQKQFDSLRVDDSVKRLLLREYAGFAKPSRSPVFNAGEYNFAAACKMATLRRFPAGAMDWEISGFPRSWLLKPQLPDALRAFAFLAARTRGFAPMFFLHVARPPRNRLLLLEKEVDQMFERIVRSMQLQPHIKGILGSAWFWDAAAVRDNPHLAALNRPFREHGGLVVLMEPAGAGSGVADRNPDRKDRLDRGELGYRIAATVWPRAAALRWLASRVNAPAVRSTVAPE